MLTAQDIVEYISVQNGLDPVNNILVAEGNIIKLYDQENGELVDSYEITNDYIQFTQEEVDHHPIFNIIRSEFSKYIQNIRRRGFGESEVVYEVGECFSNSNCSDEQLNEIFDKYGYVEKGEFENGYVKLSLDTDKYDRMFLEWFELREDITEEQREALTITPELAIDDITETGVKLYPSSQNDEIPSEYNYCFIYRSDEIDGEYKRLPGKKVKCDGKVEVVDDTLTPGTTYYYKSRMVYTNILSEPITVTTLEEVPIPDLGITTVKKNNIVFESSEKFNSNNYLVVEDITEKITKEQENNIQTKTDKILLGLYDINMYDENDNIVEMKNGTYKIKIELNDTLKKYKNYEVIYISDDNKVELIKASVEGNYIVFNTTHLSKYGVVGTEIKTSSTIETNPKTADNLVVYGFEFMLLLGIAVYASMRIRHIKLNR